MDNQGKNKRSRPVAMKQRLKKKMILSEMGLTFWSNFEMGMTAWIFFEMKMTAWIFLNEDDS